MPALGLSSRNGIFSHQPTSSYYKWPHPKLVQDDPTWRFIPKWPEKTGCLQCLFTSKGYPSWAPLWGDNSWDQIQKVHRKFQVFPGLPHRWIATSRCRGSDWPRSARPLSAVAERSASALPVASPWPQKNALNMLGCMQCIRENMYNFITIIS